MSVLPRARLASTTLPPPPPRTSHAATTPGMDPSQDFYVGGVWETSPSPAPQDPLLQSYVQQGSLSSVDYADHVLEDGVEHATLGLNYSEANASSSTPVHIPESLTDINMTQLIAYSLLFPLAAVGNLLVFVALFRNRHRKSRVNMMILHLSLADMIVTFVFLPTEITWHVTIEWVFGNFGCKVYKFLSAFGFYMSSMVLVCISLDRYFAVLHPLRVNDAQRRGKIMLFFAWLISAVISLPQSVIFKVQPHPNYPDFYQCVTFGFFDKNNGGEMMYTVFCISFLYFIPLSIIIIAYTRIIIEISKKSRDTQHDYARGGRYHGRLQLRRSNMSNIERARTRTLRMTFIIVMAFVWCWTPYALGTLWNFIDPETFYNMNKHVQDILFIIAVSNSVVNPIIYGRYSISCCRGLCDQAGYFCCCCCCGPARRGHHRLETLLPPPTPHSCKSNGNCQGQGQVTATRVEQGFPEVTGGGRDGHHGAHLSALSAAPKTTASHAPRRPCPPPLSAPRDSP